MVGFQVVNRFWLIVIESKLTLNWSLEPARWIQHIFASKGVK